MDSPGRVHLEHHGFPLGGDLLRRALFRELPKVGGREAAARGGCQKLPAPRPDFPGEPAFHLQLDRKSGGEGKRVDLGGRRIIKKKKRSEGSLRRPRSLSNTWVEFRAHACHSAECAAIGTAHLTAPRNAQTLYVFPFFFSSRRRHTRLQGDWSSDVCSSDLSVGAGAEDPVPVVPHRAVEA